MLSSVIWVCSTLPKTVVKPLRELTHKDVPFEWTDAHDKTFVKSENLIARAPVLSYLNPQLPVIV